MSFGRKGLPAGAAVSVASGATLAAQAKPAAKAEAGLRARKFRIKVFRQPFIMSVAVLIMWSLIVGMQIAMGEPKGLSNSPFSYETTVTFGPALIVVMLGVSYWLGRNFAFAPDDRKFLVLEAKGVRGPGSLFFNQPVFIAYDKIVRFESTVHDRQRFVEIDGSGGEVIKWGESHFHRLNAFDDFHVALEQYAWRAGVDL